MKYKKTFSYVYFGKRHKDLNEEELREYNRIKKVIQRIKDPLANEKQKEYYRKNREHILFLIRKNMEEKKEIYRENYRRKRNIIKTDRFYGDVKHSWTYLHFGKRHKDLTPEELKEKNRIYNKERNLKILGGMNDTRKENSEFNNQLL